MGGQGHLPPYNLVPSFVVPGNRAWRLDELGRAQDTGGQQHPLGLGALPIPRMR